MSESEFDLNIEPIVTAARRPVTLGADAKARLMAAIHAEPLPRRQANVWSWAVDRRAFLSPLGSLAVAAGLVGIGVFVGTRVQSSRDGLSIGQPQAVAASEGQLPVHDTVVKQVFVLVAPQAAKVSVVGDFNQWSATATPMTREHGSGPWTVTLPLDAGRHVYGFMVDGQWAVDPAAPLAPDNGYGHASSVVVVGRGSAL